MMHDSRRMRSQSKGFQVVLGCFLALGAILAWEAAYSVTTSSWSSEVESEEGRTHKIRIRDGRWQLKVDYRGEIEIAPDDSGIVRLGPAAFLEIDEKRRRERRRLRVTPGTDGQPEMAWSVNNKTAAFDAEARTWLKNMLPRIYRSSGLDAAGRVERMLAAEGVGGVLHEIDEIGSDSVQRLYFERLIEQVPSNMDGLPRILRHMGRSINSDYELRKLLAVTPLQALVDEATASAFLAAVSEISSDYETRKLLVSLMARLKSEPPELDPPGFGQPASASSVAVFDLLIDASRSIASDHDHATVLRELATKYPADLPLPAFFAGALRSIDSGYELRRVLSVAFRRPHAEGKNLDALFEAAQDIGSDYELAELMIEVARAYESELPDNFFRTLSTIGSDYELGRILGSVAARPSLTPDSTLALLDSSRNIGSEHELSKLLIELVSIHPLDDDLLHAFERAAESVGSEYQRERVLAAAGLS